MKTIGEQAKEFRELKGWSYTDMAREVQKHFKAGIVSRQKITQLEEAGDRRPHYLSALAKVMGTTIETLESGVWKPGAADEFGGEKFSLVGDLGPAPAPAPHEAPASRHGEPPDLVITEYGTGGAMGHGFQLEDNPPGVIRSLKVSPDWLRLNVPVYTAIANLCIVTGFGPSMKPRYNPGDPLLCDTGYQTVESDGVYFFRVDGHGFIKQLQRIPTREGLMLRAKSFNPDYDPFEITPDMDFQVFGKILTVWKSEQF